MSICYILSVAAFCATMAEVSNCNVDHMARKALNIWYLVFHRKGLPILDLNSLKFYLSNWKSEVLL